MLTKYRGIEKATTPSSGQKHDIELEAPTRRRQQRDNEMNAPNTSQEPDIEVLESCPVSL